MVANKENARSLRALSKNELVAKLDGLKKELLQLRCAANTSGTQAKACKQRVVRRSIARVLTILNQNGMANLRKFYANPRNARKTPKFLKPKLTKAKRIALKADEKGARSLRARKQASAFPVRTYFVKA
eukprot:PhM_4_TR11833/c0_g1_i1/m.62155/K02918/RP-L35e, RPL35; large subunit ribosomal protein L35e